MTARRAGFALVLSMGLILALAVLGVGVVVVATREVAIAGAVTRRAQAVRVAEAGILDVVEAWSTREAVELGIGEHRVLRENDSTRATVTRIDTALFLVRGDGRVPGPRGPSAAHAAALVRTLDPGRIARGFPGALTAGGRVSVADAGFVVGSGPMATGPGPSCEGIGPGVVAPAVSAHPSAVVTGDPAIDSLATFPPGPALDPFGPMATRLADIRYATPVATPRAITNDGACEPGPDNWGSPDPDHPCHDLFPTVTASNLTVEGGHARAVLTVNGDLTLMGGAYFEGLVVIRGRLTVDGGSVVRGAVRADSAVVLDGGIVRDACAVREAASAPSLDRAYRPPDRWWIPVF